MSEQNLSGLETSETGVNRSDSTGKPDYTLVDLDMLERWAIHMTKNVPSKGKNNWRKAKATDADRFMEGAWRHFIAWQLNPDDNEDHAAALLFNVSGYEFCSSQWEEKDGCTITGGACPEHTVCDECQDGRPAPYA